MSMWVNPKFSIHGEVVGTSQDIYAWHVRSYNQFYQNTIYWYEYCLHKDGIPSLHVAMEPHLLLLGSSDLRGISGVMSTCKKDPATVGRSPLQ